MGGTFGAETGADLAAGMFLDVKLDAVPPAFGVEDALATHAERQQAIEPSYFLGGLTELEDEFFFLDGGVAALIEESLFAQDAPHGQGQAAEAVFEDIIIGPLGDHFQGGIFRGVARDQNKRNFLAAFLDQFEGFEARPAGQLVIRQDDVVFVSIEVV